MVKSVGKQNPERKRVRFSKRGTSTGVELLGNNAFSRQKKNRAVIPPCFFVCTCDPA